MSNPNKTDHLGATLQNRLQILPPPLEDDRLLSLLGSLPVGCMLMDADMRIRYWNPKAEQILGYSSLDAAGKHPAEFLFLNESKRRFDRILQEVGGGRTEVINLESVKKDGSARLFTWHFIPLTAGMPGLLAVMEDTSAADHANERNQRQKDRIHALRTIDIAISGVIDFQVTLNIILQQMMSLLKMDAAVVLVYDPSANTLKFAAGRGLRTDVLHTTNLRIGEGYAGMAALHKKIVQVPDLQHASQDLLRSPRFSSEGFESYYCVPLIAKGVVKGVMESFHRRPFRPDPEWLDFFETLGGQAAIAIDNAMLFNELQRSNLELTRAYDSTLEGWSKALDMRDKDTEGHTRRVTEMTERLALAFNIGEADCIHIRRGAILHDIGKMGIPDDILLKEGPLSEEEWKIMRQHPELAVKMLASIEYLRPALDIPHCHHEKWDGSGYPRRLKGRQIPLAARIFAVVDVFDALTSDRPYRRAWSVQEALDHIQAESGTHFDPEVVDVFMRVIGRLAAQGWR